VPEKERRADDSPARRRNAAPYDVDLKSPGDLKGLRVTVMGLGLFGGGVGVTQFLLSRGARVTVTDLRGPDLLGKSLDLLDGFPIEWVLGRHRTEDFTSADLVVVNPAVPPDSPFVRAAVESGVPVDSEINLTFRFMPTQRTVGVTGSNGKTTTSHLVHRMVKACGRRAWLGGNTGGSLLTDLDEIGSDDVVVLELSSFQLETMGAAGLGPGVAVITNITPNHLDRHKTFESYAVAKKQILNNARAAVLNADDPLTPDLIKIPGPESWELFSSRRAMEDGVFLEGGRIVQARRGGRRDLIGTGDVVLPGRFNLENIMAALLAARLILDEEDVPAEAVAAGANFKGVPHRLETVAFIDGVMFINDSIATTPESTIAALDALDGEIALIAGGYDKGIPLDGLAAAVRRRVGIAYLIGETGPKLESAVRSAGPAAGCPIMVRAGTVEEAVRLAFRQAGEDWTVLLSPAFASYDQFINFVERGETFRSTVIAQARRLGRASRDLPDRPVTGKAAPRTGGESAPS